MDAAGALGRMEDDIGRRRIDHEQFAGAHLDAIYQATHGGGFHEFDRKTRECAAHRGIPHGRALALLYLAKIND